MELLDGLIYFGIPPSTGPLDEVYCLSVEQYREMERIGIINELDRVELLEGRLVRRSPINPRHPGDDFAQRRDYGRSDELLLTIDGQEIGTLAVIEILD